MREPLIQLLMVRPFVPFELRLQGGFVVPVIHHEFASIETSALAVSVFSADGHLEIIDTDKIVSLRTLAPIE